MQNSASRVYLRTYETIDNGKPMSRLQIMKSALRPLDYAYMLICLVLIPSAVVHGLLGIDEKIAFAGLAPVLVVGALLVNRLKLDKRLPAISIFLVLVGALASLIAGVMSQLLMGVTLVVAIIVGHRLVETLKKPKALRVASLFTLVLLVGGVVGVIYSSFGGNSTLEVQVGYRTTRLYLTTFSLAQMGDFIRPSGIFDEPGAFVMYAAIITMFNDVLRQNRFINSVIVGLLVFTGSLAGLVLTLLYLFTSNSGPRFKTRTLVSIGTLIAAFTSLYFAFPINPLTSAVDVFYSDRLRVVDGRLLGDNRSNQVSEFFSLVNEEVILRGQKALSSVDLSTDQSSNPFSITFGYGLIISLPYFILLLWLLKVTVRNRFQNCYAPFGLFLLLLQRPYLYHMSWSIMIVSVVWLIYFTQRKGRSPGGVSR